MNYYTVAYIIADSLNMTEEKVEIQNYIGQGFDRIGRFEDALQYYSSALDLLEDHPNIYNRALILTNIASAYYNMGNSPAARRYAMEALELSRTNKFNQITGQTTKILSDVYARQNNFRLSYIFLFENRMISDTLQQAENGIRQMLVT